jgi:hypothetical protein
MLRAPVGTPQWGIDLIRQIEAELLARSLLPVKMPSYFKADLPSAATFRKCWIYVPDDVGGAVAAFSDGTNWLRCTDRAVIS